LSGLSINEFIWPLGVIEMSDRRNNIERLPAELRLHCLSYCDSNTILNLCLTSKTVFDICVSLHCLSAAWKGLTHLQINYLYHHIDFSHHNDGVLRAHTNYSNIWVPPDHAKARPLWPSDASIVRRQHQLMERLNEQRDLGLQTRVLRWTLVDYFERDELYSEGFNLGTCKSSALYSRWRVVLKPEDALWGAFMCFSKITEIDLAFMT
jgi:hypothetical protein